MASQDKFIKGVHDLQRQLRQLAGSAPKVARSIVGAGLSTLSNAAKQACPGSVKKEVGFFIRENGDIVWGRAGLMQFPDRDAKGKGPHGVYLEVGTKYIKARHTVAKAMRQAMPRAKRAMRRTAARRINRVLSQQ